MKVATPRCVGEKGEPWSCEKESNLILPTAGWPVRLVLSLES